MEKNRYRSLTLLLLSLFLPVTVNPSDAARTGSDAGMESTLNFRFETSGTLGKGDYAPFWLTSNRHGLGSTENSSGYFRLATLGGMVLPSRFGVGYGMDLGVATGLQSDFFIHQLYVDLSYKWMGLSMGPKELWGELKNRNLSSGGLTWSGNSRPVPQVRLELPEYTRIPILGGWFSVKGHVSYGKFTDSKWRGRNPDTPYTDRLLYHSKAGFLRFGDIGRSPIHVTLGLEMYSQFGGTMHNRKLMANEEVLEEYRLPSDLRAYRDILLPFNDVGGQTKENGNSLGSWHLSLDYLGEKFGLRAYYEHFYEDHSGMLGIEYKSDMTGERDFVFYGFRRNWFDGLYGIELNLPEESPVRDVVLEVLNTRGQSGPVYRNPLVAVVEGVDGRDGFYTHELYDSYSHWGYAIGNPVLVSPVYNSDDDQRFKSNRLLMFHAGIDGGIGSCIDYRIMVTTSRHWGTYEDPYNEVGRLTSYLVEGTWLPYGTYGWRFRLSLGLDSGKGTPMGNGNKGVMLSISRLWSIL
ncbi:MAG: hypothetical protein J6T18_05105 [Bacteroidaceae bacterium]|nr:hypothetical protein [Bacteroidaceae bacterium]